MRKGKPFARAGDAGGPKAAELRRTEAYRRLFSGNGSSDDAEVVLAHLTNLTGFFRRPSYADWIAEYKTPHGFELHSALSNARAEVVEAIMNHIHMSDDTLTQLQRAASDEHTRITDLRRQRVA